MARFVEADEHIKFPEQLEETVGPIVLINKFKVKPEEADHLVKAWEKDATLFKKALSKISLQELLSDYTASTVASPHLFR